MTKGFCYQENTHYSQAVACSGATFWREVRKPSTQHAIDGRRAILAAVKSKDSAAMQKWLRSAKFKRFLDECPRLRKAGAREKFLAQSPEKQLLALAQYMKDNLPAFIFSCREFDATTTKSKPTPFRRRKLADCHLNGLVMLDIDHVETPTAVWEQLQQHEELMRRTKLVHITSSKEGVRIVFAADIAVGNLADNQLAFARALGYEADGSCIDATRNSFAPKEDDILYIDESIFEYYDEEYDKTWTPRYRGEEGKRTLPQPLPVREGSGYLEGRAQGKTLPQPLPCREGSGYLEGHEQGSEDDKQGQVIAPSLQGRAGGESPGMGESLLPLSLWGAQLSSLFDAYPALKDICRGLKPNQYPAAVFVAGGLLMTLLTRCTYSFYVRPEEARRLNCSVLIIGDPASGKSFATRLEKLLTAPIEEADKLGVAAINAYREELRAAGANRDKPKRPKVPVRLHPARTSNSQFIQDMVNSVEVVDGEEMQLHMFTFDTELDNTLIVQKGGAWMDKTSMELKAFHNEEDGQAYSNADSVYERFNVTWNYIYTGTPLALKKKVNAQNFGSGLATRLTVIPLPSTNFEMMEREQHPDPESDVRLRTWAERLDRTKGKLPMQHIVDGLYDWTARRMADAKDNDSRADEMLLKRCAYHGLNFAAPFIVMRHWEEMQQDGEQWNCTFETDDVDWQLAELLTNIQYACQRYFFGHMAEEYFEAQTLEASVRPRRRDKAMEAFASLPQEFTAEDVMRCFGLENTGAAYVRVKRLIEDRLAVKLGSYVENGHAKARFMKTDRIML